MKGHPTIIVFTANGVGSGIDEDLNNIECHIFVFACMVERFPPTISSTGSIRKIIEEISNYSLSNSFIFARLKEETESPQ